jgi:predicted membrane metal-binding protein
MLLGDRSFVDRADAVDFQKTGVFHMLVVAGLHVGGLAFALYWVGRKPRLSPAWTALFKQRKKFLRKTRLTRCTRMF